MNINKIEQSYINEMYEIQQAFFIGNITLMEKVNMELTAKKIKDLKVKN